MRGIFENYTAPATKMKNTLFALFSNANSVHFLYLYTKRVFFEAI